MLRAFRKRGLLEEDAAADMLTWQASGGFSVDCSSCLAASRRGSPAAPAPATGSGAARGGIGFRNASPTDFAGVWETYSDDQTSGEVLELIVSGC